jgi:hypothetical protein
MATLFLRDISVQPTTAPFLSTVIVVACAAAQGSAVRSMRECPMKTLRCSVVVAAISFFTVIAIAQASEAGPVTYSFSGVLGDAGCAIGPNALPPACLNNWSGRSVLGRFTYDVAVATLVTDVSFGLIGGDFTWRIVFPDAVPNQITVTATPTSLFANELLLLPPGAGDERFIISLNFDSSLTTSARSTVQSGYIERQGAVSINNPFVSGAAEVVPEPSSMFLLASGLIAVVCARRRRVPTVA